MESSSKYKGIYFLYDHYRDVVYGPQERADIASKIEVVEPPVTPESYHSSSSCWPEVELIFSGWGMVPMDEVFFQRFPNLKVVFYGAGTIKAIATETFWQRGVHITTAVAANAVPVAEFTLAQIFYSLKKGWQQVLSARKAKRFLHYPVGVPVPGGYRSIVGLLSLGTTGRLVAKHLQNFDLEVIAYDPYVSEEIASQLGVKLVSMEEVFSLSDVVSCHTPWLKETTRMIRGRHFEIMKSGATFINTARGGIVAEDEMIACLETRPDLLAVLDVTEPEPPVDGSPLYTLDNVILTPHIAGSQGTECRRLGRAMVEELDRFLAGKPFRYGIDRKRNEMMA